MLNHGNWSIKIHYMLVSAPGCLTSNLMCMESILFKIIIHGHVIGVDMDEDSLEIASINADNLEVEMELIQCQINNLKWRGQNC
nr:methyltransferase-like protein 5 [Tanacetum cinerariifolium]